MTRTSFRNRKDEEEYKSDNKPDVIRFTFTVHDLPPQPQESSSDNEYEYDEDVCTGIYCDHKQKSDYVVEIPNAIHKLADSGASDIDLETLIELAKCYHCKCQTHFRDISLKTLSDLHDPMVEMQEIIGMDNIKEELAQQIVYAISDPDIVTLSEMMHAVITGPPGVGKTMVVDIIAKVFLKLGFLKKNVIHKVKLNELKGKYIGHTAPLVEKAIDRAMGGVLIIDEAYSLASGRDIDSFSRELIDTLNRNLTENAGKFMCIIIGYKDKIEERFFAHNEGLQSRFKFRFDVKPYTHEQLTEILKLKIKQQKLTLNISDQRVSDFMEQHYTSFPNYGRNIETFVSHIKVCHLNRTLFLTRRARSAISWEDLNNGYKKYSIHNKPKEDVFESSHLYL